MLLTILLSIMTATYTVSSTTMVEATGDIPVASTVMYERSAATGQKGQMTAGNATRLELKGWDRCRIHEVELQMRSNANAGKGSLTMKIGIDTLWAIYNQPFNEEVWAGEYTTNWVKIAKSVNYLVGEDECIEIIISATENSLYIHSYTIHYEPAPPLCYTVSFNTGLDTCPPMIEQSLPNEGIVLPAWQDTACWYFMGWTEVEILENQIFSPIMPEGHEYFPHKNTQLWAVYSNLDEYQAVDTYLSGRYLIACNNDFTQVISGTGMAMSGAIDNTMIPLSVLPMYMNHDSIWCTNDTPIEQMFYDIDFYDDYTASITHVVTDLPIGYKANNLQPAQTVWMYKRLGDGSILFYYTYNKNDYTLFFGLVNDRVGAYAQKLNLELLTSNAMWLFPVIEIDYTSWPFGKFDAIEPIISPTIYKVYRMGIYDIHISNGKKYIYIHP